MTPLKHTGHCIDRQTVVLLDCENEASCGRWVPHRFLKLGTPQGRKKSNWKTTINYYPIIYQCEHCKQTRIFGLECKELPAQQAKGK